MRYYRLEITDKDGNTPLDGEGNPIGPFDTSKTPGRGLHIEFDAMIYGYDVAGSGTMITIHGLPISMIKQSVNLSGCQVTLSAGFTLGLPLANPDQFGVIVQGEIYNPFGNWLGTHQTMNFTVNPIPLLDDSNQKFSMTVDGKYGEKLSDVIRRSFSRAFPKNKGYTLDISISDQLVLSEDSPGVYFRPEQFAAVLNRFSRAIINSDKYLGVQVTFTGKYIRIYDNAGAESGAIKEILPQELIGQPTWIAYNVVSFKCPLRSDIHNGDLITLPQNLVSGPAAILALNSADSGAMYRARDAVSFSGEFMVKSVRHVGSYLNADGNESWVTIFEAANAVNINQGR